MKRLLALLVAMLMLIPQCSFAANADDLAFAAEELESLLEINSDYISLPASISDDISVKWYSESDALVIDGSKALYVCKERETSANLRAVLTSGEEVFEKTLSVIVPERSIPLSVCAFSENFEEMESIPEDWTQVSSSDGDIALGSEDGNSFLVIDNTVSGTAANITVLPENELKATGTNPIITFEYSFSTNGAGSAQLMYIYGGANGSAIPVNMNIYNNYAFAQSSEGNLTFLQPWEADKWYDVKVLLDNDTKKFDLYLDGELVLEKKAYRVSSADSVSKFLMGRTAGKNGVTRYDDIKVYIDPYRELDALMDEVSGDGFDEITGAVSLVQSVGGYPVRWVSSDEGIIASDGTVNRPLGEDADVLLTALIEHDGLRVAKSFNAHVVGKVVYDNPDEEIVNTDAEKLDLNDIIGSQNVNELTDDFVLPLVSDGGADIVWKSSDNSAVAVLDDGRALVVRGNTNAGTTLTATLSKGGFEVSRSFAAEVKKLDEYTGPYAYYEDFETTREFNLEDPRPKYELTLINGTAKIEQGAGRDDSAGVHLYSPNADGNNAQVHIYTDDVKGTVIVEADVKNISGAAHNVFYTYGDSGLFANMNMQNRLVVQNGEKQEIGIASLPVNKWYKMRLICRLNDKVWSVYVDTDGDGVLELIRDDLACRMETAKINHLLFGGAKNVDFMLDNVKLYQDPLFPASDAAQKLDLGRIDGLEGDMLLPTELDDGVAVEWISSDPDIIATDGTVNRPGCYEQDKNVTLYGVFDKNGYRKVQQYEATVLREKTDSEAVKADGDSILLYDTEYLTHDLTLPLKGQNGTTIAWSSSVPDIISAEGKLTRPVYNDGKKSEVVLTATVTKNDKSYVRDFNIIVPEMNYALTGTASSSTKGAYSFLVTDGDDTTSWSPADGDKKPYIMLTLRESAEVDSVRIVADISPESVEVSDNGHNYDKVLNRFDSRKVKYIKISFPSGTDPKVYEVGVYNVGELNYAASDAMLINLGNLSNVTDDIDLPLVGENGSTIRWKSSDSSVVSDKGRVNRPSSGNKSVVLTATVTNGDNQYVRSFTVTVKGESSGSSSGGGGGGGGKKSSGIGVSGSLPAGDNMSAPVIPSAKVELFKDVNPSAWYYGYVDKMARDGVLNGVGNSLFEPERAITRAEFVKILVSCLGIKGESEKVFEDVGRDMWYCQYISAAHSAGIINGTSENTFGPDEKITRQDLAVMVARATGINAKTDAVPKDFGSVSDYAADAVESLFAKGILNGDTNGCFNPVNPATRAEVAKIMYCIKYERGES